jgi:hypothetical protein
MRKLLTAVVVLGLWAMGASSAQSQNLLTNGDFEGGGVSPEFVGWTAIEQNVDQPSITVDSIERVAFADRLSPPEDPARQGLWLKPWSGRTCCSPEDMPPGTNYQVNGILSQTVPGVPGDTYTFGGASRFEQNYAGGVDTLDAATPLRPGQPSPTDTFVQIEFLDAVGGVIGSPVTLDVRADREAQIGIPFANDNLWYEHTLTSAAAPANTANVRFTAGMTNGVFNINPGQSAMLDNFTLMRSGAVGTELLTNGNLNTTPTPPPELPGYTLVEVGTGTDQDTAGKGGNFADDPATPGEFGYWVKGFVPGHSTLTQTVPGAADGDYTFTLSSAFGQNYSGGTGPTKPATITKMELAFLDSAEAVIGTPMQLDLWDAGHRNAAGPIGANPQAWDQFSLSDTSPAGTQFVRVGILVTGATVTTDPDQGAFFDDLMLTLASGALPGDYNQDGKVDAADYVVWRKNPTAHGGDPGGYNTWRMNFGAMAGSGSGNLLSGGAVPEPAGLTLALLTLLAVCLHRGRRR